MLEIDGSYGEGGGQILRTALALATVLHKKVHISKIRQGRPVPGMKAQHVIGAQAIATICSASLQGLNIGSTDLVFSPGPLKSGKFRFEVGTAGSVTLVLQTLMPVMPFLPENTRIEITGGTDVKWSPPIDYLQLVTMPMLQRMGCNAKLSIEQRGHYPKGGGHVVFETRPSKRLTSLDGNTCQPIQKIIGISHVTKLPSHIAQRQAESARRVLTYEKLPDPATKIEINENSQAKGLGSGIVLVASGVSQSILGADALGEKGVRAEEIGEQAALKLIEEIASNAFLDSHMADMIVPYLVLANGTSRVTVSKVTQHLITNVRIAEIVSNVKFEPYGDFDKPGLLQVKGLGWTSDEADVFSATEQ